VAKTLLIVDDSEAIRSIIKVYLNWHSFEFVEAGDGERAWQLMQLLPVDLVIADINMPGLDGIEFVRRVRSSQSDTLKETPVILLTGDKSEELKQKGLEAGANCFARKPITSSTLVELVRKHLPQPS
jgi:two-component system chemotaxis response regulator CheY